MAGWSVPSLDYSWIGQAAGGLAGGINQYARRRELQNVLKEAKLPDGSYDYGKLTQGFFAAGLTKEAAITAALAKSQNKAPKTGFNPITGALQNMETGDTISGGGSNGPNFKPPANYTFDPNNPGSVMPIPGGPATKIPMQEAGALAMMKTGTMALEQPVSGDPNAPTARTLLSDPSKWSRGQQFQAYAPETASYFGQSDVINAQAAVKTRTEAALRLMTGAAAPEQEVDRYSAMFTPTWNDTKERAAAKLKRLDDFVANAQANIQQGRGPGPSVPPSGPATESQYNTPAEAQAAASRSHGSAAAGVGEPVPSPNDMKQLKQFNADPAFRAEFEGIYGPGSVDRWLANGGFGR